MPYSKYHCAVFSRLSGFTLMELMITLSVLAIIVTIAVPSFTTMVSNNRLTAQHNELVTALTIARSEALKRGTTVTVCASDDEAGCNSSNWEDGWIVFSDYDADRAVDAGTGECAENEDCVVATFGALESNKTVRATLFANNGYVQFDDGGIIDSPGTFVLCDSRGNTYASGINVNGVGRVSSATDSNSDGIVNGRDGANVSCP
jgi:type IV fimbrial biogenesis protein FimT